MLIHIELKDIIDEDVMLGYVAQNYSPDSVFNGKQLTEWARNQHVEDIRSRESLKEWAEAHDHTRED